MRKRTGIIAAIGRIVERIPDIEPAVLVLFAVGTAAVWGFIEIADEVFEGETHAFDQWVLESLRDTTNPADPIGPHWIEEMARDATALGGVGWISFTTLVVAGYLVLDRKSHMAGFVVAATISGTVVSLLLKGAFARPRPEFVPHLTHAYTSSFPSAHSMLSAVVYLTLGSLVASVTRELRLKIYVLAVAVVLSVFVGLSRIYLGVHYPTDVLAGWLAGLVWALVCWLTAHILQRKGQVEKAGEQR